MGKDISKVKLIFQFCDGGSCRKAGSEQVIRDARASLKNQGLWKEVHTIKTRCNGRCEDAPTWIVQPGNYWYKNLTPEKGIEIICAHLHAQESVEEYLLYQEGWEMLHSEKERPKEAVFFTDADDGQLGKVLKTRMPSSEQDLYPLFLYLFERYDQILVQQPGQEPCALPQRPLVDYTDAYDICIKADNLTLRLAIAPLPPEAASELLARKIGLTEVFRVKEGENPGRKGVRFKNRKGEALLTIWFKERQEEIWRHILLNFLDGATDPDELQIEAYEDR
jgi:(2Fe-2S) ferredoxin